MKTYSDLILDQGHLPTNLDPAVAQFINDLMVKMHNIHNLKCTMCNYESEDKSFKNAINGIGQLLEHEFNKDF